MAQAASHTEADRCRSALQQHGVPMVLKHEYENGKPVRSIWWICTITKPDRFYRINGKVVSRNMAAWASRCGVATA